MLWAPIGVISEITGQRVKRVLINSPSISGSIVNETKVICDEFN